MIGLLREFGLRASPAAFNDHYNDFNPVTGAVRLVQEFEDAVADKALFEKFEAIQRVQPSCARGGFKQAVQCEDLLLTTREWATKHGIDGILQPSIGPVGGCGYSFSLEHQNDVALYLATYATLCLRPTAKMLVHGGFQQLPIAMSKNVKDLRLNCAPVRIRRTEEAVEVTTALGEPPQKFDYLVRSRVTLCWLPVFLWFLTACRCGPRPTRPSSRSSRILRGTSRNLPRRSSIAIGASWWR